jgi:uncharacterized protein (TIGR00251 family)
VNWYRFDQSTGILILEVHVQPGARSAGTSLLGEDALKVRIAAKAVDGAANAALAAYVGKRLGIAKSMVRIVRGATGRRKTLEVRIADFDPALLLEQDR